jgi:hypothetical protein
MSLFFLKASLKHPCLREVAELRGMLDVYLEKKNLRDHVYAITGTATREAHVTRRCGAPSTPQSLASLEVQYGNTYIYTTTFPFQLFLIQFTRSESKGKRRLTA